MINSVKTPRRYKWIARKFSGYSARRKKLSDTASRPGRIKFVYAAVINTSVDGDCGNHANYIYARISHNGVSKEASTTMTQEPGKDESG